MLAVCPGSGRDGLQQDDGLLVDEAQEPGRNNLYCGWMSGRSRLFDKPIALVEQSVVAAKYARHDGRTVSDRFCLDGNRKMAQQSRESSVSLPAQLIQHP